MKLYKHIAKNIHFPVTQKIKGEKIDKYLKELEKSQYFTEKALKNHQIWKLQKLLKYSQKHVPYYQSLFNQHGILPENIKSIDDLPSIPYLTKDTIREQKENLYSINYTGKIYPCTTSGSTGTTLNFSVTSEYSSWDWASRWRGRRWFNVDIGDKEFAIWGRPVYNKFSRFFDPIKARFRNTILVDGFNVSDKKLDQYSKMIFFHKPEYIYGYSTSVYQLANYIKEQHPNKKISSIKAVFVTAEMLYPNQREVVEEIFHAPVSNEYGCSEVGGFAYECPYRNWHISSENVIVESISINGNPNEFVITSLTNYYMPFIRYRIGDLGELSNSKCKCGVNLPILKFNAGKTTDVIRLKNGRKLTSEIFLYLTRAMVENDFHPFKNFRIIQKDLDKFIIQHEGNVNQSSKNHFFQLFSNLLKDPDVHIIFEKVKKIKKDKSGKIRYFISEITQ